MTRVRFSLDVPIRPEWRNIELLRTSILNCLAAIFQSSDFCENVGMAASELMENAVKYGDWSLPEQSLFNLLVTGDPERVSVIVQNPVAHNSAAARELLRTVQWIRDHGSAQDAYRARLLEIAQAPPEQGRSGLGLVRVAYEANCRLHAELQDNRMLRVEAISHALA